MSTDELSWPARLSQCSAARNRLYPGPRQHYYTLSSKMPSAGETVRVGGYPNRKWKTASGRVTYIISSATLGGRRVNAPMIVFGPALHQGASGSPVLNRRGQVVGIFVASNRQSNYSIAFPTTAALKACRKFLK